MLKSQVSYKKRVLVQKVIYRDVEKNVFGSLRSCTRLKNNECSRLETVLKIEKISIFPYVKI